MRVLWAQPAQDLVDWASADLVGLWSALTGAENAALWLAHSDPRVGDPRCSLAAADLRGALEELERVAPQVWAGEVVDLGPVTPLDDFATCLTETAGLLRGIVLLADEVLRADGRRMCASELVAVTRTVHQVSTAYRRLTGELL